MILNIKCLSNDAQKLQGKNFEINTNNGRYFKDY